MSNERAAKIEGRQKMHAFNWAKAFNYLGAWDVEHTIMAYAYNILIYSTDNCKKGGNPRYSRITGPKFHTDGNFFGFAANQGFAALTIMVLF